MTFDAPSAALGELVLDECGEEAGSGPALGVGPLGEVLPELVDRRQAEIGEHRGELDCVDLVGVGRNVVALVGHAASPTSSRVP